MSTQLAKQISTRMKAKSLSITTLEKEAGLKKGAVRNIIKGRSKKPSAEILQAVSDVLKCTVKDLLTSSDIFEGTEALKDNKDHLLHEPFEHPKVLLETVTFVLNKLEKSPSELSVQQVLNCVEEIYLHSVQEQHDHVDEGFADWFVELAGN